MIVESFAHSAAARPRAPSAAGLGPSVWKGRMVAQSAASPKDREPSDRAPPVDFPRAFGIVSPLTETIAQLVEHRIVVSAVAGSIPVGLPSFPMRLSLVGAGRAHSHLRIGPVAGGMREVAGFPMRLSLVGAGRAHSHPRIGPVAGGMRAVPGFPMRLSLVGAGRAHSHLRIGPAAGSASVRARGCRSNPIRGEE